MTWLGYIPAAIAVLLVVSAVLAWLIGSAARVADKKALDELRARFDGLPAIGFPAGGEPCCCGRPGCDGTGPWPIPEGDTLTLIGTELVHRRCADARRDGRAPGPCCAARLAGVKT